MNIGSLYKVKQCFWLLFPTKETASEAVFADGSFCNGATPAIASAGRRRAPTPAIASAPSTAASYWSKRFNCELTYFSPDSIVVCLEEDGKLKKFLTSEGLVGWTWFNENYNDCFEEMKTEE